MIWWQAVLFAVAFVFGCLLILCGCLLVVVGIVEAVKVLKERR